MSWEKRKLEEIVMFSKGKKLSESPRVLANRYIQIEDLGSNDNLKYTEEKGVDVVENDVIIAWDGANAGKVGTSLVGTIGSTLSRLRPSSPTVHGNYLFRFLQSKENEIKSKRTGATIPHVNGQHLRELSIPLPTYDDQVRIAKTIDKADELRKKDQQLLAKYDELLQSIFYDMFGDPVKNEKRWDFRLVGELLDNDDYGLKCGPFGSALKKNEYQISGIPVWVMDNISGTDFLQANCLFITEKKYHELSAYAVKKGDIIISRAGTVGKMAVVNTSHTKSIISTNLIKMSPNRSLLSSDYFVFLLKFFGNGIGRLKKGSEGSFTHMNTGIISSLNIPLPPMALQLEFEDRLSRILSQKRHTKVAMGHSESLFQTLLQKAFNQELHV